MSRHRHHSSCDQSVRFVTLLNTGVWSPSSPAATYLQEARGSCPAKDARFSRNDVLLGYMIQSLSSQPGVLVSLQLVLQSGGGIVTVATNSDLGTVTGTISDYLYVPYTGYAVQLTTSAVTPPAAGTIQVTLLIGSREVAAAEQLSTGSAVTLLADRVRPREIEDHHSHSHKESSSSSK